MEEVLSYAGSLSLPVKPDSTGAVVNVISAVNTVNGCVHFNSTDFSTSEILLVVDMVDVIVFNQREDTAKVTYNTGLAAVVNVTAAHNM